MSEFWQAVILGILQGLTEFLPISSSAHLILLPWFLDWAPLGLVFDVMLHAGTLLAVLFYFRRDWREFVEAGLRRLRSGLRPGAREPVFDAVVVGTVPAILVALAGRDLIESHARVPLVTVFTLSLFGLLLLWADRQGAGRRSFDTVDWRDGLLVGVAQSLALIPGVSRSGVTITAALLLGFSRPESARFSFMLAGPIIALGAVSGLMEWATAGPGDGAGWTVMVGGVAVSFVTGFFCIKYFLRYLQRRNLTLFVVYRLILAAIILGYILSASET